MNQSMVCGDPVIGWDRIEYVMEYRRTGTEWPIQFNHNRSFLQLLSLFIEQSYALNRVQYLSDGDVYKVTWFHELMSQVPESQYGQSFTLIR